ETARQGLRSLTRGERAEDRRQPLRRMLRTADHQTVAAVRAPDAAARPDIEIVDAARRQRPRAPHGVLVVAVAAVDDRVALLEGFGECGHRLLGGITGG